MNSALARAAEIIRREDRRERTPTIRDSSLAELLAGLPEGHRARAEYDALVQALNTSPCPAPRVPDGEGTVEECIRAGCCGCDNADALAGHR